MWIPWRFSWGTLSRVRISSLMIMTYLFSYILPLLGVGDVRDHNAALILGAYSNRQSPTQ